MNRCFRCDGRIVLDKGALDGLVYLLQEIRTALGQDSKFEEDLSRQVALLDSIPVD